MTPLLPARATRAVSLLEAGGFEAFAVGGCVRDLLLGRLPKDVDVTTSARPEQVKEVFADFRIVETGLRHGTVLVMLEGGSVEITTYRTEQGYSDHRHPDSVAFSTSLEADLARRDFTVNGMAYNERAGLVDCFGGLADLRRGLLRPIGEGRERFREDALRILRAFRFQARLGFSLAEGTDDAIRECAHLLRNISPERITAELRGLLTAPAPSAALREMERLSVLRELFPPLPEAFLPALDRAEPSFPLRLALVLSPLPEKETAKRLALLRLDRQTRSAVRLLLARRGLPPPESKAAVKRLLRELGGENTGLALRFLDAFRPGEGFSEAAAQAGVILAQGECWNAGQLAITGDDLLALGLSGRAVGQMLDAALDAVVDGRIPNTREKLLLFCRMQMESETNIKGGHI